MSDQPFGFHMPPDPDDESQRGGGGSASGGGDGGTGGPGAGGSEQFPFGDPQQMAQMLRQFADMMSQASSTSTGGQGQPGGTINWDMARNIARHAAAEQGDPSVGASESEQTREALRLADLWLDDVAALPSGVHTTAAWSRSEWVENTMSSWSALCEPLTTRIVESMGQSLPEEMQSMAGPLLGMVRQMGGMLVSQQAGQAIGTLAREVIGSTDVGLPLAGAGTAALLPQGVAAFGSGLEIPADEVRLYLAAREVAHHRLFGHVPWLRSHVINLVEEYARGMSVDMSGLEERLSEIDMSDPQALQEILNDPGTGSGLFEPQETPQQKASLGRLETAIALIEGWVSVVVDSAVSERLPSSAALTEAIRRRRASGGPAEHTFAALVGLELRPRRLREAATLWRSLGAARGTSGRDALWEHPDLLPSGDDLDDPEAFVRRQSDADAARLDITELTEPESTEESDPGEDGSGGSTS
ncbi:zinc-dependent metalloprotease [Lipingzhangella sp. LS1_29]|uniref:Zinc-dependent metalloprotease n=1 Tax=Lipingzhangella rawalii TaxID=2055835 RepID=A0ABU2HCI5_9ACTN|nr:zinc-dependent metalloprotease [Lipingzhangella rawalii]MDS1272550.1 zinc-dependent metalloprotease [Lipingzhangella rawalii]